MPVWEREIPEAEFVSTSPVNTPGILKLEEDIRALGLGESMINEAIPGKSTRWTDLTTGARILSVFFEDTLSGGDQTSLTNAIAAHVGGAPAPSIFEQFTSSNETLPAGTVLVHNGTNFELFQLERHYAESLAVSQTAEPTTYQPKISTTFALLGGTYEVKVAATLGAGSNNDETQARFVVDGTTVSEVKIVPKNNDTQESWSDFSDQAIAAGTKSFAVEFRSPNSGTAKISNVRIAARRIGP